MTNVSANGTYTVLLSNQSLQNVRDFNKNVAEDVATGVFHSKGLEHSDDSINADATTGDSKTGTEVKGFKGSSLFYEDRTVYATGISETTGDSETETEVTKNSSLFYENTTDYASRNSETTGDSKTGTEVTKSSSLFYENTADYASRISETTGDNKTGTEVTKSSSLFYENTADYASRISETTGDNKTGTEVTKSSSLFYENTADYASRISETTGDNKTGTEVTKSSSLFYENTADYASRISETTGDNKTGTEVTKSSSLFYGDGTADYTTRISEEDTETDASWGSTTLGTRGWSSESRTSPPRKESPDVNIAYCLALKLRLPDFIATKRVYWADTTTRGFPSVTRSLVCEIHATTYPGRRFIAESLTYLVGICYRRNYVIVMDERRYMEWTEDARCYKERAFRFVSIGNNVTLEFHLMEPSKGSIFVVSVTAVTTSLELVTLSPIQGGCGLLHQKLALAADNLHMAVLSSASGYIQTPGNDQWTPYLSYLDTWQHMSPPSDHVTLLSMRRLWVEEVRRRCLDVVEVFGGSRARNDRVWWVCGTNVPPPIVLDVRAIHVHFYSDRREQFAGFRLLYSYHPRSHKPSRVDSGLWNCSVPGWRNFRLHFLCNLHVECEGDEDEVRCSYTGRCGLGRLTLDNKCYAYVPMRHRLSWEEASAVCLQRGGRLASLNTRQEWDTILDFLKVRDSPKDVFIGLKEANPALPIWYRYSWQWTDGTIAYFRAIEGTMGLTCGFYATDSSRRAKNNNYIRLSDQCREVKDSDFLCEFATNSDQTYSTSTSESASRPAAILLDFPQPLSARPPMPVPFVECPAGHVTLDFLACDEQSACWLAEAGRGYYGDGGANRRRSEAVELGPVFPTRASCPAPVTSLPASFACRSGGQRVPYGSVCDHRRHCADGSDEDLCYFPPCSGSAPLQCAASAQCVGHDEYCDDTEQCTDGSDESNCFYVFTFSCEPTSPPAVVSLDSPSMAEISCGMFRLDPIADRPGSERRNGTATRRLCPHTHFQCPGADLCLPVFVRCNGVADCPGREDEGGGCGSASAGAGLTCPGFFRCRGSPVCLHVRHVCDGLHHCPQQDDELYCRAPPCPRHNCTCHGLAFTCHGTFAAGRHPELRYLNGAGSGTTPSQLSGNTRLVHLSLARCGLGTLGEDLAFPNLFSLDLSDNFIRSVKVEDFRDVGNLQLLILSGNPVEVLFAVELNVTLSLDHLQSMDLSRTTLEEIDFSSLDAFPDLITLNVSSPFLKSLYRQFNRTLRKLRVLDMRRAQVTRFQRDLMSSLSELSTVYAENYKLCCAEVLPPVFNPKNCHAPADRVSSCERLLSSGALRILLALLCSFALLGNVASVVTRVFFNVSSGLTSTGVLVTYLSWGDACMGVSVAVLAAADRHYLGGFGPQDDEWRRSVTCKTIGFLFLLASQVSTFAVFLIALDGLLPLLAPAHRVVSFQPFSAHVVCVLVWSGCAAVAALPLLPTSQSRELYGQAAVCLPLFVTPDRLAKIPHVTYVVAILTFNCTLTSLTAVVQMCTYIAFQRTTVPAIITTTTNTTSTTTSLIPKPPPRMASYARRVFSLCALSVACWLPLCVLAVLAWKGLSPLPDQLHVHVGTVAPPISSALRPLLYALGIREERRRQQREERLRAHISAQRRHRDGFKAQRNDASRLNQ